MPHLSIDLRAEFRAGVVDGWLADHAAGLTPNPCVRCNGNVRLDAMLELARRLGVRDARHRPLRARRRWTRCRCCAPAPTQRKDQSYVLAALAPESLARLRFPLGEHAQARRCASSPSAPASRSRASPTPRTCASSRARATATSSSATAALGERPGAIVDRDGTRARRARRRARATRSASATASASPRPSRCTCSRPTRARTPSPSARASALLARELTVREATLHRDGGCVDGVRVRAHGRPLRLPPARRASPPGATSAWRSSWRSRPSAPRPARSRACMRATWSSATARSPDGAAGDLPAPRRSSAA